MHESSKGTMAAVAAFSLWAILPVFWKTLSDVPLLETTAHRAIWTFLILLPLLAFKGKFRSSFQALKSGKTVLIHLLSTGCLLANWLIYVWTTLNERILEGALGYYINPFLYILLGFLFLGEKHNRLQIVAIMIAATGVILQFPAVQGVPWAAFALAITFAGYGMIRKKSPLGSFDGLILETGMMLPLSFASLAMIPQAEGAFGSGYSVSLLLIATGVATAAPFLFFARAARSISLSLLGILQFIGPTGQLLIGWLIYHEPMPPLRLISFGLIWLAVITYIFSLRKRSTPV